MIRLTGHHRREGKAAALLKNQLLSIPHCIASVDVCDAVMGGYDEGPSPLYAELFPAALTDGRADVLADHGVDRREAGGRERAGMRKKKTYN